MKKRLLRLLAALAFLVYMAGFFYITQLLTSKQPSSVPAHVETSQQDAALFTALFSASVIHVLPNGMPLNSSHIDLNASHWRSLLHSALPAAERIGLWSDRGEEVLWTRLRGDASAGGVASVAGAEPTVLWAVADELPFVWPETPIGDVRTVECADGSVHRLQTLSDRPRVLISRGLLSDVESAAIRRIATPRLAVSSTQPSLLSLARGLASRVPARRSWNAWLPLPDGDETAGPEIEGLSQPNDGAVLRAVWLRVASLVRLRPSTSEDMQVVRYTEGERFAYHHDNPLGDKSNVASSRVLTALLYLNEGYEGGAVNFPLAGLRTPIVSGSELSDMFGTCQTERGLTVQPRAGDLLIFYNHLPNTRRDDLWPIHGSCDVKSGVKWAANLFFELKRMAPKRLSGDRPQWSLGRPSVHDSRHDS